MTRETHGRVSSDLYQREYQPSFVEKWDELIDWEGRARGEGDFFERLLRDAGCKRILDAACGTGYHSVMLRRSGFEVLAADGAREMVEKTTENAETFGVDLPVMPADWRTLRDDIRGTFDAVLCLGNAFTHLFSDDERIQALRQFREVLEPGGLLIVDQRNYDAILDVGFTSKHRYYYTGKGVDASPEEITSEFVRFRYVFPDGAVHHLTLFPIRQEHLTRLMREAGFRNIRRFGDFQSPYEPLEPDFVIQVGEA